MSCRNRWSSAFSKPVWSMLWSTYETDSSVWTRSRPMASNCRNAIVPVASWVRVWSIRSGTSTPTMGRSTLLWAAMIFWVMLRSVMVSVAPAGALRFGDGDGGSGPSCPSMAGPLLLTPSAPPRSTPTVVGPPGRPREGHPGVAPSGVGVEPCPALASQPAGADHLHQQRGGAVLAVSEALVQDLHDRQARVQAD